MNSFSETGFFPVGFVRSASNYKFEAPRQPSYSETPAFIEFASVPGIYECARDLDGFERIWVIFCFHMNSGHKWRSLVRPPLSPGGGRYGVFATRSPYRPNPVGMSCVRLLSVEKNGLNIGGSDMLDGTPVFDIKPYIPEIDSFPGAAAGWRDNVSEKGFLVNFEKNALERAAYIKGVCGLDIVSFCKVQLAYSPTDSKCKRIGKTDTSGLFFIGCRTFRIYFIPDNEAKTVNVLDIVSNYRDFELLPGAEDRYLDKDIHRKFIAKFGP